MASQLGYDNIFGHKVAEELGLLSGMSASIAEIPELVILIGDGPVGFLVFIGDLAGAILSDVWLLADFVASLPDSINEKQNIENPYAEGTALYDSFADGWYGGYIASQIALMVVGEQAVKAVKSTEEFAQITMQQRTSR